MTKVLKKGMAVYGPGGKIKAGQPISKHVRAHIESDKKHVGLIDKIEEEPKKDELKGTSGK